MFVIKLPLRILGGILCLTTVAGMLQAGDIYKSVDANGHVVYSDHLDPSMSQSTAVQLEAAKFPPSSLHFCWTNCFSLILDNGVYRRTDGTDESWTVETFSNNGVILHRHDAAADWNANSQDVVYAGQVANDRLVDVTVNGKPVRGVDASWGTALNTLPGSNAERDAKSTATADSSSGGTVSSTAAPPPLPEEDQPPLSEDGAVWTPGYWGWREQRYFWIPGVWVRPPQVGQLWTPGYWAFAGAFYVFHPGRWGSTVGFYGGINDGHGYFGSGYSGGHWIGNSFAYNSAVNHLNPAVSHVYAEPAATHASQAFNKPAVTMAVQPISERASRPAEVERPAAVVKNRPAGAAPKINHVARAAAASAKN